MTGERPDWLVVERRDAPLIVSIPHAGTELLGFEPAFVDPWLTREDADWQLDELYDFVAPLGATLLRTRLSRSIIDVNRDPSGASLYPGQATTELVPTTTFEGESLYRQGRAPDAAEIAERRRLYFAPYDVALVAEIARLHQEHQRIALFDAHSIRSVIPRLFDGELPVFNLGTNSGGSCSPELRDNQARARGDSFGRQRLMKTTAHCHSRRERSERSGIQRLMAATLDPRSDLRSAEDDKFLKD
jgi:N-formylglutamate deformylase